MVALTRNAGYYEYLAEQLYRSMHRLGTDEDTVFETLISSTGEEIEIIKRHYSRRKSPPHRRYQTQGLVTPAAMRLASAGPHMRDGVRVGAIIG